MDQLELQQGAGAQFRDEPGRTLSDYLRDAAPARIQDKLTGQS